MAYMLLPNNGTLYFECIGKFLIKRILIFLAIIWKYSGKTTLPARSNQRKYKHAFIDSWHRNNWSNSNKKIRKVVKNNPSNNRNLQPKPRSKNNNVNNANGMPYPNNKDTIAPNRILTKPSPYSSPKRTNRSTMTKTPYNSSKHK